MVWAAGHAGDANEARVMNVEKTQLSRGSPRYCRYASTPNLIRSTAIGVTPQESLKIFNFVLLT